MAPWVFESKIGRRILSQDCDWDSCGVMILLQQLAGSWEAPPGLLNREPFYRVPFCFISPTPTPPTHPNTSGTLIAETCSIHPQSGKPLFQHAQLIVDIPSTKIRTEVPIYVHLDRGVDPTPQVLPAVNIEPSWPLKIQGEKQSIKNPDNWKER